MNIFKRGAIALSAFAMVGTTAGLITASSASAQPPVVIQATSVETSATFLAPGLEALTFNLYQPSVVPPGFRLFASVSELCLVGRLGNAACNWRLTTNAPPILSEQLTGNAVIPRIGFGQAGRITGGTKGWRGARGVFRSLNIAPNVASNTYVFSTP
jgi:hypothetical protein